MNSARNVVFKLLTILSLLLSSAGGAAAQQQEEPGAPPSEVQRAEALADEAFAAYSRHEYGESVTLYLRAYEVAPSADILYNVARIYDTKLSDRELAARFYRRYIGEPGADPERVRTTNQRLSELRELERAASTSKLEAQPAVGAGASSNVDQQPSRMNGLTITGITFLSLGVVGLGVGTGFGVTAMRDADVAESECDGNTCRSQRGLAAANDGNRAATISTAAFIAGGALSLVGTTLLAWGMRRGQRTESAALRLAPSATRQAAAMSLIGRW